MKTLKLIVSFMCMLLVLSGCGESQGDMTTRPLAGADNGLPPLADGELPALDGDFQGPPVIEADTSWVLNKELDVKYGTVSESQVMDIYYPNEDLKESYPTLVYIHGGAFKFCDKKGNILDEVLNGLNRGYVVVSINYRLSPEAIFPAAVEDCKLAIRFLKANAKQYHIDPENLCVWGESAGGNLASMVGVTSDVTDFDAPELGYSEYDSSVKAVVDWFGPLDFLAMDADFEEEKIDPIFGQTSVETSAESEYIGELITNNPEQTQKANPMNYVTENDAYFFIQQGNADRNVPYLQSIKFSELLTNAIGTDKVYFELIDGAMHGDDIPEVTEPKFGTEENINKVFTWLDSVLK